MNNKRNLSSQEKAKCYGKSAQLTVESVEDKNGCPTVNIEFSPRSNDGKPDHTQKITIQASKTELITLIALFCGYHKDVVHLSRRDKGASFERQPGKIYAKATCGSHLIPIPLSKGDCVIVCSLLIAQLKKQCFGIDSGMLMMTIRGALSLGDSNT